MLRRLVSIACLLAWLALASPANGHVGSSSSVNNRYYKLTPMGDRLRLSYTVFFGEEPALLQRRRMDKNRDGNLSADEIAAFAGILAEEFTRSVTLQEDGNTRALLWDDPDFSLGEPSVKGGPFAVDVRATLCVDPSASEHHFVFRDQLRLPTPGETELFLDPGPGIRVSSSLLDDRAVSADGERWMGGPGPAQKGLQLGITVDPSRAIFASDALCDAPSPASRHRIGAWLGVIAVAMCLVGGAVYLDRRRG